MEILTKLDAIAIRKINGNPTMSSLRIAEVTGKEHSKVTRDIEKILNEAEIASAKFGVSYLDDTNKERTHYLLPEFEFNLVISGYSVKYRAELIRELMSYRTGLNPIKGKSSVDLFKEAREIMPVAKARVHQEN